MVMTKEWALPLALGSALLGIAATVLVFLVPLLACGRDCGYSVLGIRIFQPAAREIAPLFADRDLLSRCPRCHRTYWQGMTFWGSD